MKPAFIYFDLDNTLLDHTSAESAAQKKTYSSFPELQEATFEEWMKTYKSVNHNLWSRYQNEEITRYELQEARFADSMKELNLDVSKSAEIGEAYMELYRNYWEWVEGAKDALTTVSSSFKTGIITNGFKETQELKIEKLNLKTICSTCLISEDVGKMKPHPVVFDRATELAGVERSDILYVGDSYSSDIVGGKNAGWKTAWFTALIDRDLYDDSDVSADFEFQKFDQLLDFLKM